MLFDDPPTIGLDCATTDTAPSPHPRIQTRESAASGGLALSTSLVPRRFSSPAARLVPLLIVFATAASNPTSAAGFAHPADPITTHPRHQHTSMQAQPAPKDVHNPITTMDRPDRSQPTELAVTPLHHLGGRGSNAVSRAGAYAFVGIPHEIVVLDISEPTAVRIVARLAVPQLPADLVTVGDLLFVLMGTEGLLIVDVGDPTEPITVGHMALAGRAVAVEVAASIAFVAGAGAGLVLVDFADSSTPRLIADYDAVAAEPRAVAVDGTQAYLVGSGRVEVIDVSDPRVPTQTGLFNTEGPTEDIIIYQDHAYVASGYLGLRVYDLAGPQLFRLVATVGFEAPYAFGLYRVGQRLFVADTFNGLYRLDISRPGSPAVIDFLPLGGLGRHMIVDLGTAVIPAGRRTGVHIVDVTTPSHLVLLASYTGLNDYTWSAYDVAATQVRAFVLTDAGLYTVSLDEAGAIGDVTTPWPDSPWTRIALAGDKLYAMSRSQFAILDAHSPNITALGYIPFRCPASDYEDFTAGADVLVVACEQGTVFVVDVSNPLSPQLTQTTNVGDTAPCIAFDNGKLLVCSRERLRDGTDVHQLLLFEVGARGQLAPWAAVGFTAALRDVAVRDNRAYVAAGSELTVLDISGTTPQQLAILPQLHPTAPPIDRLLLSDGLLYAVAGNSLRLVDVSVPSQPQSVGHYRSPDNVRGLTARGQRVLVADDNHGLLVLKVAHRARNAYLPHALRE